MVRSMVEHFKKIHDMEDESKRWQFWAMFFFEKQKTMIVDGVLEASLIQVHQKEKN